jgi:hypothetical protein
MTKLKKGISLCMILCIMMSMCSLFTLNTSAASDIRVTNWTGASLEKKYTVKTSWWGGEKKVYIHADATHTACTWWAGVNEDKVIQNVQKYARFKVTVSGDNGYYITYNLKAGQSFTLPGRFTGRTYTIKITSYYDSSIKRYGVSSIDRYDAYEYGSYRITT